MNANNTEREIHKNWCEGAFQQKHAEARKKVELYVQELNCRYIEKTGNGFMRYMESRMKTPESICGKLRRKGLPEDFETAVGRLNDISGVRIICYCLKEVYWIAKQVTKDGRFTIVKVKDYIEKPKKNGYESYHIILQVPVKIDEVSDIIPVELQIRTVVMDAWAGMDNRISYKKAKLSPELEKSIRKYAKIARRLDSLIQKSLDEAKNEH